MSITAEDRTEIVRTTVLAVAAPPIAAPDARHGLPGLQGHPVHRQPPQRELLGIVKYFADRQRHLVCSPRTREALLDMAADLGIPFHWYHATPSQPHIDIPVRQIARILADPRVTVVTPREIIAIR